MWFSPDYSFFGYRILAISSSVLHAMELSLDDGKNAEKHYCVLSFKKRNEGALWSVNRGAGA
jgi:hypothetical protein